MLNCLFGTEWREDVAAKKQVENDLVGRFTWRIENFSSLDQSKELCSSTFEINESRWRLKLYPNYVDHFSVFLEVPDSAGLPDGWSKTAKCNIAVINQFDSKKTVTEEFEQEFSAKQSDWGCHLPLPPSEVHSKSGGYLVKDTCVIEAEIAVAVEKKEGNEDVAEKKQAEHELVGRFTWKIENFTSLDERKLSSSTFAINENRWRLILHPKGNNVDYLSVSLEVPDSASLPDGWSRTAKCSIAVINQLNSNKTVKGEFEQEFTAKQSDWGCRSLLPLSQLHSKRGGFLVKDTCLIEAQVSVVGHKQEGNENVAEKKQAKDDLVQRFTWKIEKPRLDYSCSKLYSGVFGTNENRWVLKLCRDGRDYLSVHLEVPYLDIAHLPAGWNRTVKWSIALINQLDSKKTIKKEFLLKFAAAGTSSSRSIPFLHIGEFHEKSGGYLVKDTCLIEAQVSVVENQQKQGK